MQKVTKTYFEMFQVVTYPIMYNNFMNSYLSTFYVKCEAFIFINQSQLAKTHAWQPTREK